MVGRGRFVCLSLSLALAGWAGLACAPYDLTGSPTDLGDEPPGDGGDFGTVVVHYGDGLPGGRIEQPPGPVFEVPSATALVASDFPQRLAVDGHQVYWSDAGQGEGAALFRLELHGMTIAQLGSDHFLPFALAAGDQGVFWTDLDAGRVTYATPDGSRVHRLASSQDAPNSLAVDGDWLYWTNVGSGTVAKVSRGGTGFRVLAAAQALPDGIAVAADRIWWINRGDGTLRSVKSAGGPAIVELSGESFGGPTVTDGKHVYWFNPEMSTVRRLPVDTDNGPESFVKEQQWVGGLALADGYLYWTEQSGGAIKRQAVAGGEVELVLTGQDQPGDIAVRDGMAYWINEGSGEILAYDLR